MKKLKKELKRDKLIRQVIDIVRKSKPEDFKYLTAGWIARKLGVSLPNLSRAYTQVMGFNLREVLLRARIFKSVNLMRKKPHLSIKKISEMIDYNNSSYFIHVHVERYGISPGKLRDLMKSDNP